MSTPIAGNVWAMVLGSGPVVQLVLLVLVAFSVLCWTVIVVKFRLFRRVRGLNDAFEQRFRSGIPLARIHEAARQAAGAPLAVVFSQGYEALRRLHQEMPAVDAAERRRILLATLERALEKGIRGELGRLEQGVPFLATTGNTAPFIGLFGTVWGIMRSFHEIGLQGTASLATVAPGISEALVATAAGLAAAIPAVVAFNAFTNRLAFMEDRLYMLAKDFLNMVDRQLAVKGGGRPSGG
ncbi:Tol-Pal system subunit TolQ [Dissulfurirhabdus thermomarina]|uniref:Tol-Pal system subunit TolQ n=1 Tax=Dissulfurirhabdus thermomarina TaxID=1765737 RepID=A0A6N9TUX3_DISTH|nr:MotA/TolQ/ExbB proton channel family protein [Dissulfurirhabdus thermomarina]NDY43534.1 Tol-Pal system subunit TolQ [Dissulfurirhabdus thermomarina]NMX22919.1 Tol-Pal system subunit TolQ [Dissulfurirhabdus thermomarina]